MDAPIYNTAGKKTGTVTLPESIFGLKWNAALVHQVTVAMEGNARTPVAHTKNRGDVRGGGKKPWNQKGTGRARHGSIRSPIWKGGGVTHGPNNAKVFARTIPAKMRAKALGVVLSKKMQDGRILFVDSFNFTEPKTAVAKKALITLGGITGFDRLSTKGKNAALIAFHEKGEMAEKSFRNISSVACVAVRNLNLVSVLRNTYVIIENPQASIDLLETRFKAKKTVTR